MKNSQSIANPLKIGIFGLDNAGKTTIVKIIQGEQNLDILATLQPTIQVQIEQFPTKDMQWVIWDFGGQETYREAYLKSPQEFFDGLDILVYVFDVQDTQRFDIAQKYFTICLESYKKFSPNHPTVVFLHKVDPDLIKTPQIQNNLRYLHRQVLQIARDQRVFIRVWNSTIFDSKLQLLAMMGGNVPKQLVRNKITPPIIQEIKKIHPRLAIPPSFETQPQAVTNRMDQEISRDQKLKKLSLERKRIIEEIKDMLKTR
ncbi:MAG: Uncharacterized protein RBG13Loki_4121 [Promethearchaeota archaeon CR_4]|nr:MAG: Uncharacterized protein RBG13Loki_4121 [Candidatus Lokiarchaeota archaeon CR_4]